MRLEQLEYLIAINRFGSMSLASENLHVTPQTLSIAIKNLEAELNIKILIRSNNGTFLNKEGEYIVDLARGVLENIKRIKDFAQEINSESLARNINGQLTVTVAQPTIYSQTVNIIKGFISRYPLVNLSFKVCNHSKVIEDVLSGDSDFGYINMSKNFFEQQFVPMYQEKLNCSPIVKGRLGVMVSKKNVLVQQKKVWLKSLNKQTVCTHNIEHFHYLGISEHFDKKIKNNEIFECENKELVLDLVSLGQVVALAACGCFHMYEEAYRSEIMNIVLADNIEVVTVLISSKLTPPSNLQNTFQQYFNQYMSIVDQE